MTVIYREPIQKETSRDGNKGEYKWMGGQNIHLVANSLEWIGGEKITG
jgi:hypothetical protein